MSESPRTPKAGRARARGKAAAGSRAARRLADELTGSQALAVYRRVTGIVWQRLAPTFGIRTINAIARNVLARVSRRHPVIARLEVNEDGLDWDDLQRHAETAPIGELQAGVDAFIDEFFEALSEMIGRIVVEKLFGEARQIAGGGRARPVAAGPDGAPRAARGGSAPRKRGKGGTR